MNGCEFFNRLDDMMVRTFPGGIRSALRRSACLLMLLLPIHGGAVEIPEDSFYRNFVDLNLVDQSGKPFDVHALSGEVTLFNFIFTGCGTVCPSQTKHLSQVFETLPEDTRKHVRFVSVSVDPLSDTPDQLQMFANKMQASYEHWHFVSGDIFKTRALIENLGLEDMADDDPNYRLNHRTNLWLVNRSGHLMMRYDGVNIDKPRLVKEIGLLVNL